MSNATGTFSIRERPQHLAKEEALSISTARTSHRNSFRNSAGTDHARSFFLCGGGELFILQSSVEWGQAPRGFPPRSRSRTRHLSRPRASPRSSGFYAVRFPCGCFLRQNQSGDGCNARLQLADLCGRQDHHRPCDSGASFRALAVWRQRLLELLFDAEYRGFESRSLRQLLRT